MRKNQLAICIAVSAFAAVPILSARADTNGSQSSPASTSNGLPSASQPAPGSNPPPAQSKSRQGEGAPKSSLSPNAMTPRANPNGQSLPENTDSYGNSIRNGQAPANSGPLNPNNPKQ